MSGRSKFNVQGLIPFMTLAVLCASMHGISEARVADVRQEFAQLKDFRRIELRVSPRFRARCKTKGARRVATDGATTQIFPV